MADYNPRGYSIYDPDTGIYYYVPKLGGGARDSGGDQWAGTTLIVQRGASHYYEPTKYAAPSEPSLGGGGGGGGSKKVKPPPIRWKAGQYSLPSYAPKWWTGLIPNQLNDQTSYLAIANAVLPFLSPEDQRAFSNNISRQFAITKMKGADFPDSTGLTFGSTPSVTPDVRTKYMQSQRADAILAALARMQAETNKPSRKLGAGYEYLRQVADVLKDYGTTGRPMSRAEYSAFLGAIDPLLQEGKSGDLASYGALAKALVQPFLTGGSLMNVSQGSGGQYVFGAPNPKLFS